MSGKWYKKKVVPFFSFIMAWTSDWGWIIISYLFSWNGNNFNASLNSKTLFINVAESIEIFLPIDHFGCFIASLGFMFLNFFLFRFRNGPPDAVI